MVAVQCAFLHGISKSAVVPSHLINPQGKETNLMMAGVPRSGNTLDNIKLDIHDSYFPDFDRTSVDWQPSISPKPPSATNPITSPSIIIEGPTGPDSKNYISNYSHTNPMVAGALLDLLRETQPEPGKPLSVGFLRSRVEAFRKYLAASKSLRDDWNKHFENSRSRGIVIAAGRAGAILNAFVVLHTLRHGANCTLPVVIAHFGEEEFKGTTKRFFKSQYNNVKFLDLKAKKYPGHHIPLELGGNRREFGYKLKVYSIYCAPFQEMIFLDSDAIPLQNPSLLFDTNIYKKHLNIFWNDFWKDPVPLWQVLHLQDDPWINFGNDNIHDILLSSDVQNDIKRLWEKGKAAQESMKYPNEAESGQIVINRVKYWEVLEWLMFLNTHDSFVYRYSMGDKDTFRVAFALAGISDAYFASPFSPALPLVDLGEKGEHDTDPSVRYRCLGMLQLHPENGSPFFHHRTADSKFHPQENPKEFLSPITHVTPPITQDQASIMNWGNPGYSIFQASGRVTWGFSSKSAFLTKCKSIPTDVENFLTNSNTDEVDEQAIVRGSCPCPPLHLHTANGRCMGKDPLEIETNPEPVLVIEVPKDNFIYKVSRLEVDAYNAIPFQEGAQ